MKVDDLLLWIREGCPSHTDGRALLAGARQELGEADPDAVDPRVERLLALESKRDRTSLQLLQEDWPELSRQADSSKLEAEFRRLTQELDADQWETDLYRSIVALQLDWQEGTRERLVAFLEESWRDYTQTPIAAQEVTAETVLGHTLLSESMDLWHTALDMARDASVDPSLWGQVLETAQQASRRLAAMQMLDRRVQSSRYSF